MSTPARLSKQKTTTEKIDDFALSHAHIILPLAIIILLALFIGLCFAICGVSAVESGMMKNFLSGGV